MLVDINHWVPGDDVDDDTKVLEELRQFRAEDFNHEQKSRVAALKASREVLAERSGGPFTSNVKTVDTLDLVAVAGWIIDGEDPWRPKTVLGDLPMPGIMNKDAFQDEMYNPDHKIRRAPNGRCDVCCFALGDLGECTNPDCQSNSSEKGRNR